MAGSKNEKLIAQLDVGNVTEFKPSLFRLLPAQCCGLEAEPYIRLRFFYRYIVGYKMFLLKINGTTVSYCMFQRGKIRRYPFVGKKDLLMGPYFVTEEYRGQGLSTKLIRAALKTYLLNESFENVFAWILEDNDASKRAVTNIGFLHKCWLDMTGTVKRTTNKPTKYGLWCLKVENFNRKEGK